MKILLVDKDDKQRNIFNVYLEKIFPNAKIITADCYNRSIKFLQDDPAFDLVISDFLMSDGTGGDLYSFIKNGSYKIPFILFSSELPHLHKSFSTFTSDHPKNGNIPRPISPAEFRDKILQIFRPTLVGQVTIPSFRKVSLIEFWRYNTVLCDVYKKISKGQYVKVFQKNSSYSQNDLDELSRKSIDELYIRNEDSERFSLSPFKKPFLTMDKLKMRPEEIDQHLTTTHLMMHNLLVQLGLDPVLIKLADEKITTGIELINQDETLRKILLQFREQKDYLYDHSYLVAIVSCALCKNLFSSQEAVMDKLILASLLHDIFFLSTNLAIIRDFHPSQIERLTSEDLDNFKNHPQLAADKIRSSGFFPQNIEKIILQHHHFNHSDLQPLPPIEESELNLYSSIFILAHDFVTQLYLYDFQPQYLQTMTLHLQKKYRQAEFQKLIKVLFKNFKNLEMEKPLKTQISF